ncbi:MAG TPA: hypothetical protein VGD14_08165, partial [bacterium]
MGIGEQIKVPSSMFRSRNSGFIILPIYFLDNAISPHYVSLKYKKLSDPQVFISEQPGYPDSITLREIRDITNAPHVFQFKKQDSFNELRRLKNENPFDGIDAPA